MQHLKETAIHSRMVFAEWMLENDNTVEKIWFSDESHSYLNAAVNKQNCRVWGIEKPTSYLEKPLHDDKVTHLNQRGFGLRTRSVGSPFAYLYLFPRHSNFE